MPLPLQLRWELGSPLFGLLLRRCMPSDTYFLWKVRRRRRCRCLLAAPQAQSRCRSQEGTRLRVDGSLMGLDMDGQRSLLPKVRMLAGRHARTHAPRSPPGATPRCELPSMQWKRGHFSLLVDAGQSPTAAAFVDHVQSTYVDLYAHRKRTKKSVDAEVRRRALRAPSRPPRAGAGAAGG